MKKSLAMQKPSQILRDRPYESQVILLASGLGVLRVGIGIIGDLIAGNQPLSEIFTIVSFFLVFLGLFYYSYKNKSIKKVNPAIGIILILLLAINFIQYKGTEGTTEFNYYSGIYLIVILYNKRTLTVLLGLQLLILAVLIFLQMRAPEILQPLVIGAEFLYIDFIFSLAAIIIITFFLKKLTIEETAKLEKLSLQLTSSTNEMKRKNHLLIEQGNKLKALQFRLEKEVNERTDSIEAQNNSIEKYIRYNTDHLTLPLDNLTRAIKNFPNQSTLQTLLHITSGELNQVVMDIKNTLEKDGQIDRHKLKVNERKA